MLIQLLICRTSLYCMLLGLLFSNSAFAQDPRPFIPLASTEVLHPTDDLEQLDIHFKDVQVVGMGESTHGTHEFFTMRHRVFKYLVETHGFNTFFIEADYANCMRANAYINGAEDEVEEVTKELGLWPWITTEMMDLIAWMRAHNQSHPEHLIRFVGVDMQSYNRTLEKVDQILAKYQLPVTDTAIYPKISEKDFLYLERSKDLENHRALLETKKQVNSSAFASEDQDKYALLIRHFEQIVGSKNDPKDKYFRDIKMGENIIYHLSNDSLIKGFFWAHNGHACIQEFHKFGTRRWVGAAGGVLKHHLGAKYFCLGQDFDEGSFNVYYPDENSTDTIAGFRYTLGPVTVGPSPEGTFAANHRRLESPVFIDFSCLPKTEDVRINRIGALYRFPKPDASKPSKAYRSNYHGQESFDAMILIKKSTPTHLLVNDGS